MRYRYDLGLRFEGPERLCSWCAELATDCSCTKKLTNQYVAAKCGSLLSSSRMPDAPRAVRKAAELVDWSGVAWCYACNKRTQHLGVFVSGNWLSRVRCENESSHSRKL